jgi:hypothetical protein
MEVLMTSATQMYDRYQHVSRRSEGLILPAGSAFPEGAVAEEWKLHSTVSANRLHAQDLADIQTKGHRYFKQNVSIGIAE